VSLLLINPFEVPKGLEAEALAYWERCADVLRQQPGFISTRLHRAISPDAASRSLTWHTGLPQNSFMRRFPDPSFRPWRSRERQSIPIFQLCIRLSGCERKVEQP